MSLSNAPQVPLASLFNYISTLRSLTRGRGNYQMQLSHYAKVPANVQIELQEKANPSSKK